VSHTLWPGLRAGCSTCACLAPQAGPPCARRMQPVLSLCSEPMLRAYAQSLCSELAALPVYTRPAPRLVEVGGTASGWPTCPSTHSSSRYSTPQHFSS